MTPELLTELQEFVKTLTCEAIDATYVLSGTPGATELELSMFSNSFGDQRYLQLSDLGDDPRASLRAWALQMAISSAAKHAFDTFKVDGEPVGDCAVAGTGAMCVIDMANSFAYSAARTTPLAPLPA